jgi:hypothetical protein
MTLRFLSSKRTWSDIPPYMARLTVRPPLWRRARFACAVGHPKPQTLSTAPAVSVLARTTPRGGICVVVPPKNTAIFLAILAWATIAVVGTRNNPSSLRTDAALVSCFLHVQTNFGGETWKSFDAVHCGLLSHIQFNGRNTETTSSPGMETRR